MAKKILIVDDSALNRMVLRAGLIREYDILEAANGLEALEIIRKKHDLLSAVLLDISMPVMDGYEVLRLVRENPLLVQLPIIVVTGSDDEQARVKALVCGANDFITKPYNPELVRHCLYNNITLRETASIVNASQKDKLTGIYNREFFLDKAEKLYKFQNAGTFILMCLDIDNFKLVNDQYGALEGDRILKHIGSVLMKAFDHVAGLCGRISGDNFAGIFPNQNKVIQYIDNIHNSGILPADLSMNLVLSTGRYIIEDCSLPASAIYDRACIAKQSVKGRYDKHLAYFDESMLLALVSEQQIVSDMSKAITEHQFEVWFQPQYNLANNALIGAEALARWRHPKRGMISPGEFIPVFEKKRIHL